MFKTPTALWRLEPQGALARHVKSIWASSRGALPHSLEWLLPSAAADLVIPLHDDAVLRAPDGPDAALQRLRGGVFQGAGDRPVLRGTGGPAEVVGIQFRPGGAAAVLGGAATESAGRCIALADFPGPWCAVRERLLEARTPMERLKRLEQALTDGLARARPAPDDAIEAVLATLAAPGG